MKLYSYPAEMRRYGIVTEPDGRKYPGNWLTTASPTDKRVGRDVRRVYRRMRRAGITATTAHSMIWALLFDGADCEFHAWSEGPPIPQQQLGGC